MDPAFLFLVMAGATAVGVALGRRGQARFRQAFKDEPGFVVVEDGPGRLHARYRADGVLHELRAGKNAWVDDILAPGLEFRVRCFIASPSSSLLLEPLELPRLVVVREELAGVHVRAHAPRALVRLLASDPLVQPARELFKGTRPTSWNMDGEGRIQVMRDAPGVEPLEGKALVEESHALVLALVHSQVKALPPDDDEGAGGSVGGSPLAVPWVKR